MVLIGSSDRILHSFKVKDGTAFGFDERGDEIVRVPVTEPILERAAFDEKLKVARNNTP
jgi:nitrate reductase beta subunit